MKRLLTATILAVAILLTSTPSLPAVQNCDEMLEEKCTGCHYKNRICDKVGTKNKRAWKNTTKRMLRYGLTLADSELDTITECLVALEDNPGKFCD